MRQNAGTAIAKALEIVDPSAIKTKEDAIQVFQNLRSRGLPPEIINKVNSYLNNPIATPVLASLGFCKQDFKDGLQSIVQPDLPSAGSTSPILQGIDQLK